MTHSPASSEEEERHSASECPEGGSESDSSPDGPSRGPRGTRGQGSGAPGSLASTRGLQGRSMSVPDDAHFSMMVFRIGIPDLHQTKCLRFNPDATIWTAKQQVLCALSESLQDVLNYGLFQPATSGRDANFLEEERLLREYPQSFEKGVPYLEFRYKTRVYKQTNLDEKQLAKLHTKTGLKKFLEYVQLGTSDKVARLLDKGLDPNYHDSDSGETPLTLAAQTEGSVEVIRTLCLGGAHIDFRARDGMTALHKAACARHCLALTALLDLGGSPNYKDRRGLTPLFHTAMVGGDPRCCELLLYNRAQLGIADENGWQEIHQACQRGHSQHLEHLLFYGAEPGAQNASGNTALHICALYNKVCSGSASPGLPPDTGLLAPSVPSLSHSFICSFILSFIQKIVTKGLLCAEDQVARDRQPRHWAAFLLQSRSIRGRSQGIQIPVGAQLWVWPWGCGGGGSLENVPPLLRQARAS